MKILTCPNSHPLRNEGVTQDNRFPAALSPEYFKPHEYGMAELLGIARTYAGRLTYFSDENVPKGDWQAFLDQDVTTFAAKISQFNPLPYKEAALALESKIQNAGQTADIAGEHTLTGLFALMGELAVKTDEWYMGLAQGLTSQQTVSMMIKEPLAPILIETLGLYKWAKAETGCIDPDIPENIQALLTQGTAWPDYPFSQIWNPSNSGPFADYAAALTQTPSPLDNPADSMLIRVKLAAVYLNSLFEKFCAGVSHLAASAEDWLTETLTHWPNHEAHMGLFLTFLNLLKIIYGRGNTITKRHLDFYYQEVLGLKPKDPVPDSVFLLFELAKSAESHLLPQGTLFRGGKDSTGKDILYNLDQEVSLNQTKVAALKSVRIDSVSFPVGSSLATTLISAAPAADSFDGNGEDFEGEDKSFYAFGKPFENDRTYGLSEPAVGLALASALLRLSEGNRSISITLSSSADFLAGLSPAHFKVSLTGEKEWISPDQLTLEVDDNDLKMTANLSPSGSPVIDYDPELHGIGYNSAYPLIRIELVNQATSPSVYNALRDLILTSIDLTVTVKDIRSMVVQTDTGDVDPAKPFQPFGVQPTTGASLYIGYDEMFRKNVTHFTLDWDWVDKPSHFSLHYEGYQIPPPIPGQLFKQTQLTMQDQLGGVGMMIQVPEDELIKKYKADLEILSNGTWEPASEISLFSDQGDGNVINKLNALFLQGEDPDRPVISSYQASTTQGFMRLRLTAPYSDPFGHKQFPALYTRKVMELNDWNISLGTSEPVLPNPPYTPVMENITLSYTAQSAISIGADDTGPNAVFHIQPFGPERQDTTKNILYPLPRFAGPDAAEVVKHHEAQFYIGLTNAVPLSKVSMLFHIAEGSGDPETPLPEVAWSYYSTSGPKTISLREIEGSDETKALIGSGILTFTIPKDIDVNPLVFGGEHAWLTASVFQNSRALPRMVNVYAQAGQAVFQDQENAQDVLDNPVEADTISKFIAKPGAVKKVSQPLPSFGGSGRETPDQFYPRVAERLHHKKRAITLWDYERLVLEKFLGIYKVKCLSHTVYNYTNETEAVSIPAAEFAPGGVTLVVIPKITGTMGMDAYSPRASLKQLSEIKTYIEKHSSLFVRKWLAVTNPLYERIHVTARVEFVQGKDFTQYSDILKQDIKLFLAPWAAAGSESGDSPDMMVHVTFERELHQSDLVYFMEQQPYVDYVKEVTLEKKIGDGPGSVLTTLIGLTARSILVTDTDHTINPVS